MLIRPSAHLQRQFPPSHRLERARLLLLLVAAAAIVTLAACGRGRQAEPTPFPTSTPVTAAPAAETPATPESAGSASVDAAGQPDSPLPPDSPMPTPTSIAEALGLELSATTGALTGVIFSAETGVDQPVPGLQIGLAEVIRDPDGNPRVGAYEASSAPRVDTDANGRFAFSNLEPGAYTLIADYVVAQVQLQENGDGATIVVDVKPNEVTDLGELHFPKLPIPEP